MGVTITRFSTAMFSVSDGGASGTPISVSGLLPGDLVVSVKDGSTNADLTAGFAPVVITADELIHVAFNINSLSLLAVIDRWSTSV